MENEQEQAQEPAPNPSKAGMNPVVYDQGLSEESALNRILYRLHHIDLTIQKKKTVLQEGNIAKLEVEIFAHLALEQDLIDVCRELASLTYVSIQQLRNGMLGIANLALANSNFQQEQGSATPPNA